MPSWSSFLYPPSAGFFRRFLGFMPLSPLLGATRTIFPTLMTSEPWWRASGRFLLSLPGNETRFPVFGTFPPPPIQFRAVHPPFRQSETFSFFFPHPSLHWRSPIVAFFRVGKRRFVGIRVPQRLGGRRFSMAMRPFCCNFSNAALSNGPAPFLPWLRAPQIY